MKIINQGRLPKSDKKQFICNYCGCVFIASSLEYISYLPFHSSNNKIVSKEEAMCRCPTCKKIVYHCRDC